MRGLSAFDVYNCIGYVNKQEGGIIMARKDKEQSYLASKPDSYYSKNADEYTALKAEDLENVSGGEEYYINEYGTRVRAVTDFSEVKDGGDAKKKRGHILRPKAVIKRNESSAWGLR